MAGVKKGNLTAPPEWWRHLRDQKRVFWKRERRAAAEDAKRAACEHDYVAEDDKGWHCTLCGHET